MSDSYPITRIFTDSAGITHFEDGLIDLSSAGEIGALSDPIDTNRTLFRSTGADYDYDWHPTPARQFILMMSGEIEIEVGDGAIRRFVAGDTLFLEDTTPPGHRTRNIGAVPRYSVFIQTDAPVPYRAAHPDP
ncbi:MAG: hypothetical protein ACOCYB_10445 [Alkalispirochaeta sp.]